MCPLRPKASPQVRQRFAEVAEQEGADGCSGERMDVAGRHAAVSGKWNAPIGWTSGLYAG